MLKHVNGDLQGKHVPGIVRTWPTEPIPRVINRNFFIIVATVYEVLAGKYSDIRKQARSVGINTKKVDMDVVPIIAPDGMEGTLYIPDRKTEKWLVTNPPFFTIMG
ncbi:hypothetical protein ACIQGW_12565 [Lysinibacillus xylanilyticus]|uniref:SMODS domain-containing nucleotidyltransferase n=1 Tax=Lysinibacillus xylanilyticus TaxID=582475 RepID=UPI003807764D